jgi:hypothetical protein
MGELPPALPTALMISFAHPPRLLSASKASMEPPALPVLAQSSGPSLMTKAFVMFCTFQTPTMCLSVPCACCLLNITASRSRTIMTPTPPTMEIKSSLSFTMASSVLPCHSAPPPMWVSFAALQGTKSFHALLSLPQASQRASPHSFCFQCHL